MVSKNPSQNQEVKAKCVATNLERYGVDYPSQNPESIIGASTKECEEA
jgi:hypothetical protein